MYAGRNMASEREKALKILIAMLAPNMSASLSGAEPAQIFGDHISDLAFAKVFEKLWTREGLDLKTRSRVTVAILIALRANEEMATHFPAAVRNGATQACWAPEPP